jgi:hypothetical protein
MHPLLLPDRLACACASCILVAGLARLTHDSFIGKVQRG